MTLMGRHMCSFSPQMENRQDTQHHFVKKNYIYDDGEWEIRLIFDCNFNPDIAYNYGHEKIQITKLDIKGIKQKLYNNLQPIIDAQRKPRVNLQWLFDIIYKDKFN